MHSISALRFLNHSCRTSNEDEWIVSLISEHSLKIQRDSTRTFQNSFSNTLLGGCSK